MLLQILLLFEIAYFTINLRYKFAVVPIFCGKRGDKPCNSGCNRTNPPLCIVIKPKACVRNALMPSSKKVHFKRVGTITSIFIAMKFCI